MADPLDTGTWRWRSGLARWRFELPAAAGPPAAALLGHACRLLDILPGFAVAAAAALTTDSGGEDAAVLPRGTPVNEGTLTATFGAHDDIIELELDLDLVITAPDGVTEAMLWDGARLGVQLEGVALFLEVILDTDVYARRTWGRTDNEALARSNAPRLAAFLARVPAATGARFRSLDTASYLADQVTEHGFS